MRWQKLVFPCESVSLDKTEFGEQESAWYRWSNLEINIQNDICPDEVKEMLKEKILQTM